jgi:16S rRNA processing protein RimM
MSDQNLICVGAIAGSFGVRGEVRLKSFCANPEDIGTYTPLFSEKGDRGFDLKITRAVKGGFAARIVGVMTKEAADGLRGTRLFAPRTALPALPDDEFYHSDLLGLNVVDTGGAARGKVAAVLNHGAGDILELRSVPNHKGSVLVPFTQAVVPTVDLSAKRIVIDPPEGLFDDDV